MTREEHREKILSITSPNILLELPTSFGKTKIALDILKKKMVWFNRKVLIVIPRNVLESNWKDEFNKWGMEKYLTSTTFTTYVSLPKHAGKWDMVIFDECHHLSERCRESLASFNIKYSILLSATVKYTLKDELREVFSDLYEYRVSTKEAINEEVLPDPRVFLIPLTLKKGIPTEIFTLNKNVKRVYPQSLSYSQYWQCKKHKDWKFLIHMTEEQYYGILSNDIEFYKRKSFGSEIMKNIWLHKCGERLKWLAEKKNPVVKEILKVVSKYRTLTFCNNISQTEELGEYCINSKNKESILCLEKFNNKEINHITACNMLNEGMNLVNCQIGIYANLNSSETIIKQRLGRILRHKNPIIIIPYYKNTRDEELVDKMLEDYNPSLITIVDNIMEIENKIKYENSN